jgi:hypothetical protein
MPLCCHVHADLVGATRLELDLEQRRVRERLERLVVRDGVLAVRRDREPPARPGMPADRRVDRAGGRIGVALHDRVVDLADLAIVELPLEFGVRALGLRDHHEPTRAHVEAVHDAGALSGAGRTDAESRRREGAEHRRALPADRRMRGDSRGLVDHDDVVVVMHDREVGHDDRDDRRLDLRLPLHLEPAAGCEPVRLAEGAAIEGHAAGLRDLGRERSGESEQLGDRGIHAFAGESLGYGKAAGFHVSASSSTVRRRAGWSGTSPGNSATARGRGRHAPPAPWPSRYD